MTTIKYPAVAESLFYALHGAVHGGQSQSIAQGMLDDTTSDPAALCWSHLEEWYYDKALNRTNVVLFDIHRLLNLPLTPDFYSIQGHFRLLRLPEATQEEEHCTPL